MATGFGRRGRGDAVRYVAKLDDIEREVLHQLVTQVRDLIASAAPEGTSQEAAQPGGGTFEEIVANFGPAPVVKADQPSRLAPRDPAFDRLLPAGTIGDDDAAAEFRALTEQSLIARKLSNLAVLTNKLAEPDSKGLELSASEAVSVVVALTDVRLVLADRLGIHTEEDSAAIDQRISQGGEDEHLAVLYSFSSWLQESLSRVLRP